MRVALITLICLIWAIATTQTRYNFGPTTDPSNFGGRNYIIADYGGALNAQDRIALERQGVRFIDKHQDGYLISYPTRLKLDELAKHPLSWRAPVRTDRKSKDFVILDRSAAANVRVLLAPDQSWTEMMKRLGNLGLEVLDTSMLKYSQCEVRATAAQLENLTNTAFVRWVEPTPAKDEELRYRAVPNERTNVLTGMQYNLSGAGVVVGIGDGGKIGQHIDLDYQVENYSPFNVSGHATHVAGIVGGRPNLNPLAGAGVAPEALLKGDLFSSIIINAENYLDDFGMVITNNSYGAGGSNCTNYGIYNLNSAFIDAQLNAHDTLLHVFSAGNSGGATCSPYARGFRTITNGWQTSKNVLCVGMTNHLDVLTLTSSRGPTNDGRLKPEVVAVGNSVTSTRPGNNFWTGGGTSYSAPAVSGLAALLYERYRDLYAATPSATLIKAILMNSADDLGNPGPDFKFGYGRVNGRRAITLLDSTHFFLDTVTDGGQRTRQLEVRSGVAELRIMLAWTDPFAVPAAVPTLLNDLDLQVIGPDMDVTLPLTLQPAYDLVDEDARPARDSLNVQEQVVISNPEAGTYEIVVDGYDVATGTQDFHIVYDFVYDELEIVYPAREDQFTPGQQVYLRWDAYGNTIGEHTIPQYRIGSSAWSIIGIESNDSRRWYSWDVPNVTSDSVQIRIWQGAYRDSSEFFTIMAQPDGLALERVCPDQVKMQWNKLDAASTYAIYRYDDDTGLVQQVGSTSDTYYFVEHRPEDGPLWLGLSGSTTDGIESRRTALEEAPTSISGACPWQIDLANLGPIGLQSGRHLTSTALQDSTVITLEVQNYGQNTITAFDYMFQVNGGPIYRSEFSGALSPGDTLQVEFEDTADFSGVDTYVIHTWVDVVGDTNGANDTMTLELRHLANTAITLPWLEDFETTPDTTITQELIGLPATGGWDYSPNSEYGRLRTAARDEMLIEGARSITLDASVHAGDVVNNLDVTLNVGHLDTAVNDVRLTFDFLHHEIFQFDDPGDVVQIRGADTLPWITMLDLSDEQDIAGVIESFGLFVTDSLRVNGQNFSPSFQMRFGQEGDILAVSRTAEGGYTFDNIRLFSVDNDIALDQILAPAGAGCELGVESVMIQVSNTAADTAFGVAVCYAIDGGPEQCDTIDYIAAESDTVYTFATAADLSGFTSYDILCRAELPADSYPQNDTLVEVVANSPRVSTFPYLEDFETGTGGWIASGVNSSLELGEPAGSSIVSAAGGKNAWVTNLSGNHNSNEVSYLTSPCFDLSSLSQPVISFALNFIIESNYDSLKMEFSTDTSGWQKLMALDATNWYNDTVNDLWESVMNFWHVVSTEVPVTGSEVQFRLVFHSDVSVEFDGFGFDLVSIFDKHRMVGDSSVKNLSQAVAGDDWVNIERNGNLVFSIHPHGQDLGEVSGDLFFHTGPFQADASAHYAQRVWVLTPEIAPTQPVTVRAYYTHAAAFDLLVSFFSNDIRTLPDPFGFAAHTFSGMQEDSLISNNTSGVSTDIVRDSVFIAPYDNGYYAEFRINSFSELWLSNPRIPSVDTVDLLLANGSDDAHEYAYAGAMALLDSTVQYGGTVTGGVRFNTVLIPQGTFIREAYIRWIASADQSDSSHICIEAQAADDASAFGAANYDLSLRARGGHFIDWNVLPHSAGDTIQSPSIRLLVQEVVNRAGWIPGNAFSLVLTGSNSSAFYSYEHDVAAGAQIVVEYDTICSAAGRLYVDLGATGNGSGLIWTDAMTNLQQALDLAAYCPDIEEIWVARGLYVPSKNDQTTSFRIANAVRVLGGFEAGDTVEAQRDPEMNETVLTGNIGVEGSATDNSWHVVEVYNSSDTAVIDGFTIRDGQAFGAAEEAKRGAGIDATGHLVLSHCILEENYAEVGPSALNLEGNMFFTISNCTFRVNSTPPLGASGGSQVVFKEQNSIKDHE